MKLITFFFVIFYANFAFSIEPVVLVHGGAGTIAASRVSDDAITFLSQLI